MATERIATHPRGAKTSVAMTMPPSSGLTAIARQADRGRPEVLAGVGGALSFIGRCSSRSVSAWVLRPQQFAFLVLDQFVDLMNVLRGGFVEILLGAADPRPHRPRRPS